jgi:hypothetical protein
VAEHRPDRNRHRVTWFVQPAADEHLDVRPDLLDIEWVGGVEHRRDDRLVGFLANPRHSLVDGRVDLVPGTERPVPHSRVVRVVPATVHHRLGPALHVDVRRAAQAEHHRQIARREWPGKVRE